MYVSLHNHTAMGSNTRGFLDSINRVEDLIDYTFELGHKGIAITDHDCITAHMDAVDYINSKRKEAKESGDEDLIKRWNDYRLILGNEIYLCSRKQIEEDKEYKFWHFILLSKDAIGHKQIRELSTRAWTQNAFTWVNIRTPTFYDDLFEIVESDRGHLMASTACFVKGTKVITKNGEKNIEDITNSDYVKNMYGEWEKVNFPTNRDYNGKGYEISLYSHPESIVCTEDHEFLVVTNKSISKWRKNERNVPYFWRKAKELKDKNNKHILLLPSSVKYSYNYVIKKECWHEILFPITPYSNRKYMKNIEEVVITPELMRFFGLFLGDGSISINHPCITLSFNKEEFPYYKDFVFTATKPLDVYWSIQYKDDTNKVEMQCTSVDFVEFMFFLFGNSKSNTKFVPEILKNISREYDIELLFGYLLADGYFRYRPNGSGKAKGYSTGEFVYASVSKKLAYDYYYILNSLGISSNIFLSNEKIDKNKVNHKKAYYVSGSNKILGQVEKKKI